MTVFMVCVVRAAEVPDKDVFYLEEAKQPALELKALWRAPLRLTRERDSVITYLAKGRPVTVLALGESEDYVSVQTATDTARGWVDASALEAPPAELLNALREHREHAGTHGESIENHEVTPGMSADEVLASLGKPDRRSSIRLPVGNQIQEQWMYLTYRYLPTYHNDSDEQGRMRQVVSYQRVAAGRKIVIFLRGAVVSVTEEAGPGPGSQGPITSPWQPNAAN